MYSLPQGAFSPAKPTRVGIVGWGRIGGRVAANLGPDAELVSVLTRGRGPDIATASLSEFFNRQPEIVLECASPEALAEYGHQIVARGIDLVPLSLCALLDEKVLEQLRHASRQPGAGKVFIAPGAIGTLDLVAAARESGLSRIIYRTAKPLRVWRANAAAALVDLDKIECETMILRGSVRDLSRHFPRNLNLSVGIALAGLGFERTEVELFADPVGQVTRHELEIWATPGHCRLFIDGTDPDPIEDCADYTAWSTLGPLRHRAASIRL
jgi:aspartate dehydrogenase